MAVSLNSMLGISSLMPELGEIPQLIRYASEHQQILLVITSAMVLLALLCSEEQNRKLQILYLAVIVYMTLLNRKAGYRRYLLAPLWSYRRFFEGEYFRRQIINNILLFIPLGTVLSRLRPKWSTLGILVMISMGIEVLQYLSGRGFFETDDIISNSLGGLIGLTLGMLWMYAVRLLRKLKDRGSSTEEKKNEL